MKNRGESIIPINDSVNFSSLNVDDVSEIQKETKSTFEKLIDLSTYKFLEK